MKSFALLVTAAVLVFSVSGCVGTATPIAGSLVTASLKSPVMMGDNTAGHSKIGSATATGIIGFVNGDCSIHAAMEQGGITKVHHVDSEVFNVLGVYATYKTVVYGD